MPLCAYLAQASEPIAFEDLAEGEREGWVRATAMILDLALPASEGNDGEAMRLARACGAMARRNLSTEVERALEHREDMRRIQAEVAAASEPPSSLTRREIEQASGVLLNEVGRVMRIKRIRHDIGAQETDEAYRARLLAELDRQGVAGLHLGADSPAAADPFDTWLASWWPEWQIRHGRGVSWLIDPTDRQALAEAFAAGLGQ